MPSEETTYFFSYAREDAEFVLKLAKELRAAGANLWVDQLDILGGERWDRAVEKALMDCQGIILILSPESVASDNVMDEVSYALEENKPVVPVLHRACDIPLRLRRVQYIDFTINHDAGLADLLRSLRIERSEPTPRAAETETPIIQHVLDPESQGVQQVEESLPTTTKPAEYQPAEKPLTQRTPTEPISSSTDHKPTRQERIKAALTLAVPLGVVVGIIVFYAMLSDPDGRFGFLVILFLTVIAALFAGLQGAIAGLICNMDRRLIGAALTGAVATFIYWLSIDSCTDCIMGAAAFGMGFGAITFASLAWLIKKMLRMVIEKKVRQQ